MMMIDGHEDLAYNAVELGRDLTAPVEHVRAAEGASPAHGEGTATVTLPALRAADVRIVLATLFTYAAGSTSATVPPGYHSPEEAFQRGRAHLRYYHRLQEEGQVTILHDQASLDAVLDRHASTPGFFLVMEGADPLRIPQDLEWFVERGVRMVGPAWKATRYAGGTGAPGPLTELGRELLREMDRLGVALDVSHLAEEAFWEAMDLFHGKVVATHANCRALVAGERQLSDDMIRAIAERDGVVGLVLYNRFIRAGWTGADGKDAVSLRDVLSHASHLIELVGARHIAIGSDLDGGLGREDVPREIDTAADLPRIVDTLRRAGYDDTTLELIMEGNWRRTLRSLLR